MSAMNYSADTINKWYAKFTQMVKDASKSKDIVPHFGTGNSKTHAINEGTLPFVTCDKCARSKDGCGHTCYAFRNCLYSPDVALCYARNTVARRRDAKKYYTMAFASAYSAGVLLRLNEGGDFENVAQFNAACEAAKQFPTVKCITYTHRREIAEVIKTAPKNMIVRYSTWKTADNVKWAKSKRIPFAAVADDVSTFKGACPCPSQLRMEQNKKLIAEGKEPLPDWSCAACAAAGCGCANKKRNIVFKTH